ncbi:myeloperoxidase-like isoform X1 [Dreissena polymorpha]|uniref:myeloperoxidase-like isoform X1 n=1 Tax=Dreissena polymorpha TaxID=45954 RepID=UPI00226419B7|nr:myeloperoxidase-like isoform X1 [Dreissena polymorpha]
MYQALYAALCFLMYVVNVPRVRTDTVSKLKDAVQGCAKEKWAGPANGFGCPLRKIHQRGQPTAADADADRDLSTMMRKMRKEGISVAELENNNVVAEFKRLLKNLPLCPKSPVRCNPRETFRSINGTCNNLKNPTWGMSGVAERRLLPAAYDDGLNLPRSRGIDGKPLPFARTVSNAVHRGPQQLKSPKLTLQAFQFGQFLDHDIILTPLSKAVDDCCAENDDQDNCFNINFAEDDPFVPRFKTGYCMEVPRSAGILCKSSAGGILQRQQTNDLTSFVDASNVYGSSEARLALLREGTTPFMKVSQGADGPRLPDGPDDVCRSDAANGIRCSIAGDVRVNEIPSLISYHNVFVLEHNRLANGLRPCFPDDEDAFQQTRKLLIGIMQKIVYDEFLPAFLSPTAMTKNKLASSNKYKYDSKLDPTAANVFGIAFRMGHTWIPTFMSVFTKNFQPFRETLLNLTFGDPNMTYIQSVNGGQSGMQGLSYALSALKSQNTDRIIEDTVRNNLFVNTLADTSFDLASLNIQRGRDHGLPSYNEFRKWCGLSSVSSWYTSSPGGLVDHTFETITLLKAAGYSSPQDIDFFPGALSEKPVSGGTLGPTMECIIGDQFRRLKFGDRFFYQNKKTGFNKAQQAAIQKYSLASLLCQNYNFDKINFPNVFKQADPLRSCHQIADIDVNPFCVSSAYGSRIPNNGTNVAEEEDISPDSDGSADSGNENAE